KSDGCSPLTTAPSSSADEEIQTGELYLTAGKSRSFAPPPHRPQTRRSMGAQDTLRMTNRGKCRGGTISRQTMFDLLHRPVDFLASDDKWRCDTDDLLVSLLAKHPQFLQLFAEETRGLIQLDRNP